MRKVATVTITTDGRDKGKIFHVKEMSAYRTATWITRAMLLLAHSGVDIPSTNSSPEEIMRAAYAAIMQMKFDELAPLLNELMTCVTIQPDPRHPNVIRPLMDHGDDSDDIEEYSTRFQLLWEIFKLHTGIQVDASGTPLSGLTSASVQTSDGVPEQPIARGPRRRGPAPGVRR
jgi:hypothetical protein